MDMTVYLENLLSDVKNDKNLDVLVMLYSYKVLDIDDTFLNIQDTAGNHKLDIWIETLENNPDLKHTFKVRNWKFEGGDTLIINLDNEKDALTNKLDRAANDTSVSKLFSQFFSKEEDNEDIER